MADIKITGGAAHDPIQHLGKTGRGKEAAGGFDSVLKDAMSKVSEVNNEAEQAISKLAEGGDITEAVVAMQKADMSFQVMLEVRNKLLSAYEEIMRMQV